MRAWTRLALDGPASWCKIARRFWLRRYLERSGRPRGRPAGAREGGAGAVPRRCSCVTAVMQAPKECRRSSWMLPTLNQLLKDMVGQGGSDLHITTNSPPQVRIDGVLRQMNLPPVTPSETKQLCYSILTDNQKHRLEENLEIDLSFGLKGLARSRANIFHQRGAIAAVFRQIPFEIRGFRDLGLPPVIEKMCEKPRGLVLVTGPTGSGKSTTLAAMLDKVNREPHEHIVTVEDPVEYLHSHKNCIVNQREIHADTHSFENALR